MAVVTGIKEIFLSAAEIESPVARSAFLDDACAGNETLRGRVDALLAAHERPEAILDRAAVGLPSSPSSQRTIERLPAIEGPGSMIGPYKLL